METVGKLALWQTSPVQVLWQLKTLLRNLGNPDTTTSTYESRQKPAWENAANTYLNCKKIYSVLIFPDAHNVPTYRLHSPFTL